MASTLDQQYTGPATTDTGLRRDTDRVYQAARFTPTFSGGLTQLEFYCARNGTPSGNMWVEIWNNNAGVPGNKIGGNSGSVSVGTVSTSVNWVSHAWSSNYPQVTAGATYWLVLSGDYSLDINNHIRPQYGTASASGIDAKRGNATPTWATEFSNTQMLYKQYADPALIAAGGGFLNLLV